MRALSLSALGRRVDVAEPEGAADGAVAAPPRRAARLPTAAPLSARA
ncbi:hypothetical protein GCM10010324_65590 [Streptomyces hiroshimensis]|uniref:Uncharacterized protein n=1 Tax=Streptomyces hiroshimensis TaxID=66424 RepID=A0ABQ2Z9Y1_9ACTN|nr:hypothetical protein GCM10010324_65590 [Streptomyces hiroshimensis]